MNPTKPVFRLVVFAALLILAVAVIFTGTAQAQKGSKGGGGGDKGPSYQIIPLDTDDAAGGAFTGTAFDINLSRLVVGSVDVSAAYWSITEVDGEIRTVLHFLDDS